MRTVIAGSHGKVGQRLVRRLVERGDEVVAMVRSASQITDLRDLGAQVVLMDLELDDDVAVGFALEGADAVVFAAGAGPGSGAARKDSMDRAGAAVLADAAERVGVHRYVLLSSMGVDDVRSGRRPAGADDVFWAYLQAKARSEDDLRGRFLAWTVLRPGRLTDDPGTGRVRLGDRVQRGDVTRDDVAAVVAELLHQPAAAGRTFELTGGPVDVPTAVRAAIG